MDEEIPELLFFDTFSHDTYEKLNLDLVQFPKPVYITEVRIIPLGARVQADFPGGVRLGATNPSQFKIELFVNDLGKPGAPTFECLGDFEYNQNNCIHLECGKQEEGGGRRIPTDGLVLKGFYTTITLAVYGILTANIAEPIVSPRETTPQPEAPVEMVVSEVVEPVGVGQEWPEEPPSVVTVVPTEVFVQKEYPEADGEDIPKDPRPYARRVAAAVVVAASPAEPTSPKMAPMECGAGDVDKRGKRVSRSTERQMMHYEPGLRSRGRSHEYSRSPEFGKEYGGGGGGVVPKQEWSRSPDHYGGRSRRIRSGSYDRVRRGSSYDVEKDDRRRPRSPIDSPRRPRSPDPMDSSNDYEEDDFRHSGSGAAPGGHGKYEKRTAEGRIKAAAASGVAGSPASVTATPVASPALAPEEDALSATEQFEPILSDEEITEDYDFDMEYEPVDEYYKAFNPFAAVLQKYVPEEGLDATPSVVKHLENLLKNNKYGAKATADFGGESADFKEGFVDYTEQCVQLLNQIFSHDEWRNKFEKVVNGWIDGKSEGVAILMNCIKLGLDVDRAMTQPQPASKLRHMKAGIRLTEFLGSTEAFIKVILEQEDFNIFDKLLGLYAQSYMALSIKLMIIRSIYACLDTKRGLDYFLSPEYNGYQILLDLIQENPSTRISFALKSLLKKINLYENLDLVRSTVRDMYAIRAEPNFKPDPPMVSILENCFADLTKALTWDAIAYSQPKRFLPVSAKFEIHKDIKSALTANRSFVAYFNVHHLLETIVLLLEMKLPCSSLIGAVYDLLAALLKNHQKLHYLADHIDSVNVLLKLLFQHCPMNDESHPEDLLQDLTRGQLLGLEMAYKLQTIYYLDAIGHMKGDLLDLDKLVEHLQGLFYLANNPFGKRYVVEVLSMDGNLKLFLDLIESEKRALAKDGSPGVKHKSPILSYSVDLVDCVVRHCPNAGYLVKHGETLLNLVKQHEQFESSVSAMLQEMAVYLKPLEIHELFANEDINPLVELMKRSLEFITTFPGDLIMALRLLRHFGIPDFDGQGQPSHVELKYKYTILQFYSADGKTLLISILEKLNTYFDQPAIHASSLASMQGVLLTQILTPLIQILRKLMTYLIECRNTEFKDLTVIEPLLRTYALMQSVPLTATAINDAREIQKDIIKILLAFTQPTPMDGLDTNNIHKSLWTQMVGELIKFILFGPNYFIPGLLVFSELLPLPLPIQCRQELTPLEINKLVNERQLWSAHLHPQSPSITEMIQTICPSSYTPLLVIFSRVCLQLSDLAPNMTLLISKAITDLIIQEPLLPGNLASTSHARLFSFLGSLVCHASVKVSVLSILSGRIMDLMTNILLNPGQTPAHQQTQENIYMVFQNLLDSEFAMMFGNNIAPMMQLACSLPPKEIIESCCGTIVENISSEEVGPGVMTAALRTMLLLTEHDITFTTLIAAIEKRKDPIMAIVQKFADKARENPDTYRQIFILLGEFWRSLVMIDESSLVGFNLPKRTVKLTPEQLASLVFLPTRKEGHEHSAADAPDCTAMLKELLVFFKNETVKPIEPVEPEPAEDGSGSVPAVPIVPTDTLEENILYLMDQLKDVAPGVMETQFDFGVIEPLPQAEGIVTQYSSRNVFIVSEEFEDQLKASYWLSFSPCEDDLEREQIPCDLNELAMSCLSGDINLTSDCKRLLHLSASPHSNRDRVATAPCFRTRRVEVEPSTGRPEKKIFATPLRGRGFTRAPITRSDLFRSRPPNTSRPPSLHVDDFLALETCGAQPTGPTGYNKLSRDIITIRGSGRGRGRSFSDRGRSGSGSGWGQGGGGGGGGSGWSGGHDGPSGSGGGKHFGSGGGGGGGHSHYREQSQNHFGAPHVRSRSGRGFNRYGGRPYSRPN